MTAQCRISRADVPHLEKGYSNLRQPKTQARRQNGGSQCEHVGLENVYDCHPTSRSSSWYWLFEEFTCNQTSTTKNSETIVRCNKQVGQRRDRNSRDTIVDKIITVLTRYRPIVLELI